MKKRILIIGLCFTLLIMSIGYSIFSSKLNITGSSSITSNWDIEITNIEQSDKYGNIKEISKSYTEDEANFSIELESPGDYARYKIEVTNKGTIPAIATLANFTCSNSAFECGAYAENDKSQSISQFTDLTEKRLIISPNEKEHFYIYILFKNDITKMPENKKNEAKLNLIYKQSDIGGSHKDGCYTGKILKNGTISITNYNETCGAEVTIPETIDGYTVTEIADGSWQNGPVGPFTSKNITKVTIPDTVTYIGVRAFELNKITELNLGSSVKEIGEEAFSNNNLTNVNFPSSLTKIGVVAFGYNSLTKVNIPNSVTSLGWGAFSFNKAQGDEAFIYNRNSDGSIDYKTLNSYAGYAVTYIKENIEIIGGRAFDGVSGENLTIPKNVKVLGTWAFVNSRIRNIKIEEGLEEIGDNTFSQCGLQRVTIPSTVTKIGNNIFLSTNIKTIAINKKEGSLDTSTWKADNATINWIG